MSDHGFDDHGGNLDQLGLFPLTRNLLGSIPATDVDLVEEIANALAELDAAEVSVKALIAGVDASSAALREAVGEK